MRPFPSRLGPLPRGRAWGDVTGQKTASLGFVPWMFHGVPPPDSPRLAMRAVEESQDLGLLHNHRSVRWTMVDPHRNGELVKPNGSFTGWTELHGSDSQLE